MAGIPWHVDRTPQCPAARPWGVILDADGKVVDGGCHSAHDMANRHMAALYANEPKMGRARDELLAVAGPFLNGLPHLREQPRCQDRGDPRPSGTLMGEETPR